MPRLKVNVWRPKEQNVGHTSMMLPDKTYISWWPGSQCSSDHPTCKAATHDTFELDAEAEGESYPPTFSINVDEEQVTKISTWWKEYRTNEAEKYHILTNNCSTVVYKALSQAFPELDCFKDKMTVWVPLGIQLIAQDLADEKHDFSEGKVADITTSGEGEARQIAANGGVKSKYLTFAKVRKVIKKAEAGAKKVAKKVHDEDQTYVVTEGTEAIKDEKSIDENDCAKEENKTLKVEKTVKKKNIGEKSTEITEEAIETEDTNL